MFQKPFDKPNLEDINPGEALREIVKSIYPLEIDVEQEDNFLKKIDQAISADGEFIQLVYNSTINYLVRRLVNTGAYIKRKNKAEEELYVGLLETSGDGSEAVSFLEALRNSIKEIFSIDGDELEQVISVLLLCLSKRNQDRSINKKKKKRLKNRQTNENGLRCYICGSSLSESGEFDSEEQNSDELLPAQQMMIEHVWPKAMGGSKDDSNLKISCKRCSEHKADYIDSSDFHYEEISLSVHEDSKSFSNEFKNQYKVALWAKSNYGCILCGGKAERTGTLKLLQRNPQDSWHYLNIDSYCEECISGFEISNS